MATPIEQLQSFLVATHRVDEEIFDLLKASGVESISDYIGLYAESEYEDGLKEWTEKSQNFRGNKIQLSRLRIAWVTGRKELLRDTPSGSTDDVDFEAPLPADVRQKQDGLFYQKFNTKLPLELTPAAPLFNRHFREFRKQAKTLDDLSKVKSAVDASAPVPQKGGTSFRDVLSLLRAHQILLNSWAMTGTTERRSKINPSPNATVTDFALADALWYHTFVTDHLRAHPGPADEAIRWTLDRDRQTRQAAVALYGDGWPLSEALRISVEQKTAVLWQIGPMGALADAEGPMAKRARLSPGEQLDPSTQQPLKEADVCDKWNAGNCTKRQRDCPLHKKHRCSFRMPNGSFCGAWQHNKAKRKQTKSA